MRNATPSMMPQVSEKELELLTQFLEAMLQLDPTKRATAAQLLTHPWLDSPSDDRLPGDGWFK